MNSSLMNPSMLGFDLVRRPGGARVAKLVREALALAPVDLEFLAAFATPDDPAREEAWFSLAAVEQEHRATGLLADVREAIERDDTVAVRATVGALEQAPLGSLDSLLNMIRHEILDWTWRRPVETDAGDLSVQDTVAELATTVICDAVAASYLEHRLDDATRRTLVGPWVRASRLLDPRADDLGPRAVEVTALLSRLRLFTPSEWMAVELSSHQGSAASWARAAHDATWAAVLTDRLRASAAAQMRLVEVMADAPVDHGPLASGLWNALSGVVLERVTGDVLPAAAGHRLRAPVKDLLRR